MSVLAETQAHCFWRANRTDFTETHRISQKEKKNQKKKKEVSTTTNFVCN